LRYKQARARHHGKGNANPDWLQMGASMKLLAEIIGISPSALSRRHDAAQRKVRDNANTSKLAPEIIEKYWSGE
jgi:hypothetical protein